MTPLVHEVLEYFSHVVVIWSLLELQIPAIIEIGVEFLRETSSQGFDGSAHFLILDPVVLIILIFALQPLPWESTL